MSELNNRVYNKIILLVLGIPVLFLLIFTVVSVLQLHEINSRIEEGQSQTLKEMIAHTTPRDSLSEIHRQFLALAVLEEESLSERYRQGHYSLVSRSFKQFLGFFTGIIMVIVGCVFILLKLREDINAAGSHGEAWKFSLVTNSPGVVFGIVGAVLIIIASTSNDRITVRDSGLYLTREYLVAPFFSEKGSQQDLDNYMKNQPEDNSSGKNNTAILESPHSGKGSNQTSPSTTDKNKNHKEKITIQHPPKSE